MSKVIDRMKLVFLALFVIGCLASWAYQVFVVGPPRRCEAAGNWWDPQGRTCATPVDLRSFPRLFPPPVSAAAATQPAVSPSPANSRLPSTTAQPALGRLSPPAASQP